MNNQVKKEDPMRKSVLATLAVVLLSPILGLSQVSPRALAEIPFEFHAGTNVLPAGSYEFKPDVAGSVVRVVNTKSSETIMVPIVTRLSQRPGNEALVVFDRADNQYFLSEIHIPGMDGFHLAGAPGPHTHVTVKAKK